MNFVTTISNMHELSLAKEYGVGEVLLGPKSLARMGKLDASELENLATSAKAVGLKTVLVWDILSTEFEFLVAKNAFEKIDLAHIDCVRAQDPGVMHYLASKGIKLQLNLETGNHNLVGIKKYLQTYQALVDKIILSIELPEKKILEYCQKLDCPIEILGVGPILLFYTPRKLLGAQFEADDSVNRQVITALAESEESPHKGFPVIENTHGTFMYHIKNFFILEYYETLVKGGLQSMRLDLWDVRPDFLESVYRFFNKETELSELKTAYGKDIIRGFYHINKSDVLFKRLKNHRIQRNDESYIGEVVDVIKEGFIVLNIKEGSLKLGDQITYKTPEGKLVESTISHLMDLDQGPLEQASRDSFVLVNIRKGVVSRSQIYLQ